MNRALQRKVFAGCRELGIDEDARRDLQRQVTGKQSLSNMTDRDMLKLVDELGRRGAKFTPSGKKRPAAKRNDVRFIFVLWRLLGEAGELRDPSREGLNKFVRTRFGPTYGALPIDVDQLNEVLVIDAVITALRKWCARAGVEIDNDLCNR